MYLLSGSEIVNDNEIIHRQQKSGIKPHNKIRRRSTRPNIRTPKKENKAPAKDAQHKLVESVELCLKCISELEEVVAQVDKLAVGSDLTLNTLKDLLFLSLDDSLANRVKQEMMVLKKSYDTKINESEERVKKAETEVKKLQGRLGSLIEEKNTLSKRIRYLEDNNLVQQDRVQLLHNAEANESAKPTKSPMDKRDLVDLNPADDVAIHETAKESEINSQNKDSCRPDNLVADETEVGQPREQYDFVFLCDSNRRFIDTKLLCPKDTVKIIPCGNTDKAMEILSSPRFNIKKGLIINTGVNDIEHLSIDAVTKKQMDMVESAMIAFPGKKIILSSITPRDDSLNQAVLTINSKVQSKIMTFQDIVYVNNNNLQEVTFFFDHKHLNKKRGVPEFATNLKRGIRLACSIKLEEGR